MSKWLKQILFGVWGLLLIPLIVPILKKWLEENVFSDSNDAATTVFRNAVATTVFDNILALGQQRWFKFALVFLTGVVLGVSLEWLNRKSDEKKASEFGDLVFALANVARRLGIDPEEALRATNAKFEKRFRHIELELEKLGKHPKDSNLEEMDALWNAAKELEKDLG